MQHEIDAMLRESPQPNVTVACLLCEGEGHFPNAAGQHVPCDVCDSTGSVPSAEEWAVHAYDGVPGEWGENPDIGKLVEFVEAVQEHGDAFAAYWDNCGGYEVSDCVEGFQQNFIGEFASRADLAEHVCDELDTLGAVPEHLRFYFDYAAYGRDMVLGGGVSEVDGYYFWNH